MTIRLFARPLLALHHVPALTEQEFVIDHSYRVTRCYALKASAKLHAHFACFAEPAFNAAHCSRFCHHRHSDEELQVRLAFEHVLDNHDAIGLDTVHLPLTVLDLQTLPQCCQEREQPAAYLRAMLLLMQQIVIFVLPFDVATHCASTDATALDAGGASLSTASRHIS